MSFTIIDSEFIAGAVLGFKRKKYNCIQQQEGEKAGEAWIEFVEEDKDQEFSQTIFDAWKAEYKARPDDSYKEKRLFEYPSIGDQLDMIYHAGQGGDAFQAAIKAVKDKYPKPE